MRWITGLDSEFELVSGSADGNAIVWSLVEGKVPITLIGHESAVNVVDGFYKNDTKCTVIITASMDSTLKVWMRSSDRKFSSTLYKK